MRSDESQLRHPAERPLFWAFVVLNVLLMAAAIFIVLKGSDWLQMHAHLARYRGRIRVLAVAAVFGFPASVLLRNGRHALIVGKSIAISPQQLPQIHAILLRHCERLGIDQLPNLCFSDMSMTQPVRAYTSWKRSYIVVSSKFLQPDLEPILPFFAFWLGCEIGCLRLHHASLLTELLLVYVDKIPGLSNSLRRVFTYSEDRYGAFLAPEGCLTGLAAVASGRLMLPELNASEYLKQVSAYGGVWARFGELLENEPTVSRRIKVLLQAGLLKC
jgi:hypothetical protein